MSTEIEIAKIILDENYNDENSGENSGESSESGSNKEIWKTQAPLPPDILCLCVSFIVEEKRHYFDNGQLASVCWLVDGTAPTNGETQVGYGDYSKPNTTHYLYGAHKAWSDEGRLEKHVNYINGQLHGEYRTWHPNGQPQYHDMYEYGYRHGKCRLWHDNGQLESECEFVNDEPVGEYKPLDRNGCPL